MKIISPELKFYVDKINAGQPFSFVRYGNGEWDCILNLYHQTRSGSQRFDSTLQDALIRSLVNKREGAYFTALQSASFLQRVGILPQAEMWIVNNAPDLTWYDGEVFTKTSMKGKLYPLVAALKKQQVVVVGPKWLKKLPFASAFIQVASHDCWKDADMIEDKICGLKNVVVSFSAGPATKALIHRLQPVIGKHSWLIDFGSVWDPYCGVHSRRYHQRMKADVIRRNLTGK